MKLKAKRSPGGSGSGRGSSLALAALAAMAAAFLLVPVAAQAATGVETLKVEVTGTGSGTVEPAQSKYKGVPPINCAYVSPGPASGTCETLMNDEGEGYEAVNLRAHPAPGSEFVKWTLVNGEDENCVKLPSGDGFCLPYVEPPGEGPGEFGEATEITAEFKAEVGELLTLDIEAGNGTVVSNPAGITCSSVGESPKTCAKAYAAETEVTLTASPASGYLFKGWKQCDAGKVVGRQCTVKMSQAKTVGASFVPVHSLQVEKSGQGTISTSPGGIKCGPTCPESIALYKEGSLTVRETPAKHFHFVNYTEGTHAATACSGVVTETCTIASFDADSALKAVFAEDNRHSLTFGRHLGAESGGQVLVTSKPPGIVCTYTCTSAGAEFYEGEEVELKFKLGKGTTALNWKQGAIGTCTGKVEAPESSCKVTIGATNTTLSPFLE